MARYLYFQKPKDATSVTVVQKTATVAAAFNTEDEVGVHRGGLSVLASYEGCVDTSIFHNNFIYVLFTNSYSVIGSTYVMAPISQNSRRATRVVTS